MSGERQQRHFPEIHEREDPRKGLYPGFHQYRAVCDCGWVGRWFDYESFAKSSAYEHGLSGARG